MRAQPRRLGPSFVVKRLEELNGILSAGLALGDSLKGLSHGDRDALCRATGSSVSAVSTPGPEVARTLSVTATYLLSEDGRKASLLAGGDGHAVQQLALQVPANRLHLVCVDSKASRG